MKEQKKPVSRKDNLVVQELDGEVLIYDLDKNKAFCLNETSALVWQMCDGNNSIAEISNSVGKKLNAPANEDLVWLAIDQLKKEKLINNGSEIESKFQGMNRREVIKKVGLGTMIALPIVTAMVAPVAANASSAVAATCTGTCMCTQSAMAAGAAVGDSCTAQGGSTCSAGCAMGCTFANNGNTNGTCA